MSWGAEGVLFQENLLISAGTSPQRNEPTAMFKEIANTYERNARIYPSVIVALPIVFSWYGFWNQMNGSAFAKIGSGSAVVIAGIILLSYIVRFFGKRIEPQLWRSWDGAPSTRYLRKGDGTLSAETKQKLYEKFRNESEIDLATDCSDQHINQAFAHVRNILRKKNVQGLYVKHNWEYGFSRNLMGSRWLWMALAFLGAVSCFLSNYFWPNMNLLVGGVLNTLWMIVGTVSGFAILPGLTKGLGERYAEDALLSYVNSNE